MSIPTFDQMLRPLLALAAEYPITRRTATEAMSAYFALSNADQLLRIPSGASTLVANRTGWAMTFLTKAALIAKSAPKTYLATERGREFLAAHPVVISVKDLQALSDWEQAWQTKRVKSDVAVGEAFNDLSGMTPTDAIDTAIEQIRADVRVRLLESILSQTPAFFEQLVLDVLIAMGYGTSRETAATHLGRSGDEGIDGRINQDALGLDQILIQAKRYAPDKPIDRATIQAFVDSLAGQGVSKGVFITTSYFADSAQEFVRRGLNTKVILIDGDRLLDLMIAYKVGVRAERTIELVDLDQNYFSEDE